MRKAKQLFLHIGTEKTGTTSIQKTLKANRALLEKYSIYIPDFLHTGRNSDRLVSYLFQDVSKPEKLDKELGLAESLSKKIAFRSSLLAKWQNKIVESQCHKWIISSEHLQSRLHSVQEIAALWDFLCEQFEEIFVIIYLRDPVQTAFSSFSTAVSLGASPKSLHIPPQKFEIHCNHKQILERWLSVVPIKNMLVRLFDRSRLFGNDVVSDFMGVCGASVPELAVPLTSNKSLSLPALKLLILLNERFPRLKNNESNPTRKGLSKFVKNYYADAPPLRPTQREISEYSEYYKESISFLKQAFFSYIPGNLWNRPHFDDNLLIREFNESDREVASLIGDIWSKKQRKLLKKNT